MESEERWQGFAKRWNWRTVALIATIALCAMSCKSPNGLTRTHRSDSLAVVKKYEMNLAPVPMSVAKLAIPMGDLTRLPIGTGYNERSGQATVELQRGQGDTIIVTATCDSLARQVIRLTEELTRIRDETSVVEKPPEMIRQPTGWQWFWIRIGQLAVAAIGFYLLYRVNKQYLNKKKLANYGKSR